MSPPQYFTGRRRFYCADRGNSRGTPARIPAKPPRKKDCQGGSSGESSFRGSEYPGLPGRRRPTNLPIVYRQMWRLASVLLGAGVSRKCLRNYSSVTTPSGKNPMLVSACSVLRSGDGGSSSARRVIRGCRTWEGAGTAGRNIPGNTTGCCARVPGCVPP